jgi:hypothetical protein
MQNKWSNSDIAPLSRTANKIQETEIPYNAVNSIYVHPPDRATNCSVQTVSLHRGLAAHTFINHLY